MAEYDPLGILGDEEEEQQRPERRGPDLDDFQEYNRKLKDWKNKWKESKGSGAKGGKQAAGQGAKQGGKQAAGQGAKQAGKQAAKTAEKDAAKAAAKTAAKAAPKVASEAAAAPETLGLSLVLAIPDLIKLAWQASKTKIGKVVASAPFWPSILACFGCIFIFLFPFLVALLAVLGVGGMTQETYRAALCPTQGDFDCYLDKVQKDPCYKSALTNAETATDVPWEVLAAIDFKLWELGEQDTRGVTNLEALTQIGKDVQKANLLRNDRKELIIRNGQPVQTVKASDAHHDFKDLLFGGFIIRAYRCMFIDDNGHYIEGGSEERFRACYCKDTDRLSELLNDKWMAENSKVPGMKVGFGPFGDADYTNTGALVFYNMLISGCEGIGLDANIPPPGTPSPNPGVPGECKNGISSVPSFLQCSPPWGSTQIDGCSDNMCAGGCGLTSLTMVLNWYGKGVTPADTIAYANSLSPVPYSCTAGWYTSMYASIAQHYGMTAEVNTLGWDGIKQKLQNCEPIIVGITGGGFAYSNHLVVLNGIDDAGVHVTDPYPLGASQFTVSEDVMSGSIGNVIYVHN